MNLKEKRKGNLKKLNKTMRILLLIFIIFVGILTIGYGSLPFILANELSMEWIKYFGIITVPSSAVAIVVIIIQIKIFFETFSKDDFKF